MTSYNTIRAAVLLSCAAFGAEAQEDVSGFYGGLFGGLSALQEDDFTLGGSTTTLNFDSGAMAGLSLGYDYGGSPWRSEIEFAYRTGDATDFSGGAGSGGDLASTSLMINGYYQFATRSAWQPYVGAGLGVATEIDFDIEGGSAAGEYSDSGVFAAQIMAGARYAVSDRVSLYGELRYFTAGSPDLETDAGQVLAVDYDTLDLLAGVVFRF
ncbi:outer membrane protein [Roseobacter sinensis]|uniref:Outer membrane beta-barrel protein n=1 Tax=Roseobacter sinensis TaxID=2931391 RepID=A0ABT3BF36_9RHOB|nr:outer membrane beta-barrel protein [Roseobacter sp. WL0113]MCV3272194.1 outer membrane beta-barrel protein [Roseobacter sp. WL0113]